MPTARKPVAVVILPTYNEVENIGPMLTELCSHTFPTVPHWDMKVLVVDGNSTDGTPEVVLKKAEEHENVFLFQEGSKRGLGAAYLTGFRISIEELGADVVFEFDADFQHPLECIPTMLGKIDEGYDYVIGSRKIPGGGETADRDPVRMFLTHAGSFVSRVILFFPGRHFRLVTDPTSGLRATRVRGVAERLSLNPDHLYSKKFGYKLQLLHETLALGARYAEIPLQFQNRRMGTSKFEAGTITETLGACVKTRLHS